VRKEVKRPADFGGEGLCPSPSFIPLSLSALRITRASLGPTRVRILADLRPSDGHVIFPFSTPRHRRRGRCRHFSPPPSSPLFSLSHIINDILYYISINSERSKATGRRVAALVAAVAALRTSALSSFLAILSKYKYYIYLLSCQRAKALDSRHVFLSAVTVRRPIFIIVPSLASSEPP